jgi:hypothetical protein
VHLPEWYTSLLPIWGSVEPSSRGTEYIELTANYTSYVISLSAGLYLIKTGFSKTVWHQIKTD